MEATQVCYDAAWLKRLIKAVLVFSIWLILYYQLVGHTPWVLELMTFMFFGLLLGTTWVIYYGEKGAQTRFENGTGLILGPGIHFMWNLFPPFRQIGMTLGLGVEIIEDRYPEILSRDDRHLHQDTRDVSVHFRIPSLISLWVYNLVRTVSAFLFNFKEDNGRFAYYKMGRLVSLTALLLGNIANTISPMESPSYRKEAAAASRNSYVLDTLNAPREEKKGSIFVSSTLRDGQAPTMPLPKRFVPQGENTNLIFFASENDPRKYIMFREPKPGKRAILEVKESLCAVVPEGREIFFISQYRPRFEINMEKTIRYVTKPEKRYMLGNIERFFTRTTYDGDTASWLYVHNNWDEVDVDNYNYSFKAKALTSKKIPGTIEGENVGGLVCF